MYLYPAYNANSLERLANIMARDNGIKVILRGMECSVCMVTKTITVPEVSELRDLVEGVEALSTPDSEQQSELMLQNMDDLEVMTRAFIDHEVGHIVGDTKDYDVGPTLANHSLGHEWATQLRDLVNYIEDVRIEAVIGDKYLGAERNLWDAREILIANKERRGKTKKQKPIASHLGEIVYMVGSYNRTMKEATKGARSNRKLAAEICKDEAMAKRIMGIRDLENTQECVDLAIDMIKMMVDGGEKYQNAWVPNTKTGRNPEANDNPTRGGAASEMSGRVEKLLGEVESAAESIQSKYMRDNPTDTKTILELKQAASYQDKGSPVLYLPYKVSAEMAKSWDERRCMGWRDTAGAHYSNMMTKLRRKAAIIQLARTSCAKSSAIMRMIKGRAKVGERRDMPSGRLDHHSIARYASGQPCRPFTRQVMDEGKDTTVSLLIDCSSSMEGSSYNLAISAAYNICSMLEVCKIKSDVYGYFGDSGVDSAVANSKYTGQSAKTLMLSSHNVRRSLCQVVELKCKSQRVKDALEVMSSDFTCGGTPSGEALTEIHNRISNYPESRKILILVTDGVANCELVYTNAIRKVIDTDVNLIIINVGRYGNFYLPVDLAYVTSNIKSMDQLDGVLADRLRPIIFPNKKLV